MLYKGAVSKTKGNISLHTVKRCFVSPIVSDILPTNCFFKRSASFEIIRLFGVKEMPLHAC